MKRYAFTLAETLITLGIIGIVATLTLPSLITNYKSKVYVAQLQKAYNQISNQLIAYMVDEDTDDLTDTSLRSKEGYKTFLTKYFRVVKICTGPSECMGDAYNDVNNNRPSGNYSSLLERDMKEMPCVILNTGASICPSISHQDYIFFVDVNGKSMPNVIGRDLFVMIFDGKANDKILEVPAELENPCMFLPNAILTSGGAYIQPFACFKHIQMDGWKMNY